MPSDPMLSKLSKLIAKRDIEGSLRGYFRTKRLPEASCQLRTSYYITTGQDAYNATSCMVSEFADLVGISNLKL
jgi:hypothetical protein